MKKKLNILETIFIFSKTKILKLSLALLLLSITTLRCKKQDFFKENIVENTANNHVFFNHTTTLSPLVNLVFADIKKKMNDKQIAQFIDKAGIIYWDKAKAYKKTQFSNRSNFQNSADSIIVFPVALPNTQNVNAALVAHIFNNGDSVIYSSHFKNHFNAIDSVQLPNNNITARQLYVLGMAQLDEEVFGHKKFIVTDRNLRFGQQTNSSFQQTTSSVAGTSFASISFIHSICEYTFTYSSSVVYPPVTIWSYSAPCGSPIMLPPASFLQGLDEFYGFQSYSSVPVGEGGSVGGSAPYSLEFSSFYQALTANQKSFLENQEYIDYYHGFIDYLILHQFSQEAKDKIIWSINYLTSPTTLITTFSDFKSTYLNDFPSLSFLPQDDINWITNYPYLKSRIYFYLQQPNQLNKEAKVQFHINKLRTESEYFTFNSAYSTYTQYPNLWFNDYSFLYDLGGSSFGEWAINYLILQPSVHMGTFQNQFMGKSEGADGDYDASYWDNPNLSFPPQSLPTWANFNSAYPGHHDLLYDTPEKMYLSIGGSVYTNGYTGPLSNTCGIRLSKALNYSGVTIPNIPGSTFKGTDNKYYFLGAAKMIKWMKKTFGTTTNPNYSSYNNADGGTNGANFPTVIGSKKGIFGMLPNVAYAPINNPTLPAFRATGHCDLINNPIPTPIDINSVCDGSCYFQATGGVKEISIWTLN